MEDRDAVAERHRLDLVVRHVDRRRRVTLLEPHELGAHRDAQRRVQVRERLVEEEDLGPPHEGAPERDALPLPARELRAAAGREGAERPQVLRRVGEARLGLRARDLPHLEAEGEVLAHGHVRVERVALEDHRDVPLARRDAVHDAVPDRDRALGRLVEARDEAQRRRLAAPRGPDEDEELAGRDVEIEAREDARLPVRLADLLETNPGQSCLLRPGDVRPPASAVSADSGD